MSFYYFDFKKVSRGDGANVIAAAAYRSGSRLFEEKTGHFHDFTDKTDVLYSEILTPPGDERAARDRGALWNAVERREMRKDARLANEIQFALPEVLGQEEAVEFSRTFVRHEYAAQGIIIDLNVHWETKPGVRANPHAHVLMTTRRLLNEVAEGVGGDPTDLSFGPKRTDCFHPREIRHMRAAFADHLNAKLAELGHDLYLDHRSFKAQGIALEPQRKTGPTGPSFRKRGLTSIIAAANEDLAARNGDRIIKDPALALSVITRQRSTFTRGELSELLRRHSDDAHQLEIILRSVMGSVQLVPLGRDQFGRQRFTSREMVDVEERLQRSAEAIARPFERPAERRDRNVRDDKGRSPPDLALERLSLVVAHAGEAKDALMLETRTRSQTAGRRIRALAPSGSLAERFEAASSIPTIAVSSVDRSWGSAEQAISKRDVIVVEAASLLGARQLQPILERVELAGAQAVLLADPVHLQLPQIGAPFRAIAERHPVWRLEEGRGTFERQDVGMGDQASLKPWPKLQLAPEAASSSARRFAERRQIFGRSAPDRAKSLSSIRDPGGRPSGCVEAFDDRSVHRALRAYAKALVELKTANVERRFDLSQERRAMDRAAGRLEALWPGGGQALSNHADVDPVLISQAAAGRTGPALAAIKLATGARRLQEPQRSWSVDLSLGRGGDGRADDGRS